MVKDICVVGAGAAGLSFAWHLARLRPDLDIDIMDLQRPVPGAGVVMSPDEAGKYSTFFAPLASHIQRWDELWIRTGDYLGCSGGHDTIGLPRASLIAEMRRSVRELPRVRWRFSAARAVPAGYRVVVGADGARSRLRQAVSSTHEEGTLVYLWCSVRGNLPALFDVVPLSTGFLVIHGYPYSPERSTLVLEADNAVLAKDALAPGWASDWRQRLADLVRARLSCDDLRLHTSTWRPFVTVRCERWTVGPLVLIGDAAHTVHFSVGSGTSLALDDGQLLAEYVAANAPEAYEIDRRPTVDRLYKEGLASQRWFERLAGRRTVAGVRTAFALRSRREVNTFSTLARRDPAFVALCLRAMGLPASANDIPSPQSAPLTVGPLCLRGRSVAPPGRHGSTNPYAARLHLSLPDPAEGPYASGIVVTNPDQARRERDADFLAVAAAAGGRVIGTELAATVQSLVECPVLLIDAQPLSADEINTQLTAGVADLHLPCDLSMASLLAQRMPLFLTSCARNS